MLITSNDSRLRLYDVTEMQELCKFKGLLNRRAQIRASFSHDGRHIICGSDTGHVFLWPTTANTGGPAAFSLGGRKVSAGAAVWKYCTDPLCLVNNAAQVKCASYESFLAHDDMVTVAILAPRTTHTAPTAAILAESGSATKSLHEFPHSALLQPLSSKHWTSGADSQKSQSDGGAASAHGVLMTGTSGDADGGGVNAPSAFREVIVASGPGGEIKFFESLDEPKLL